jgi:hypothetical protein
MLAKKQAVANGVNRRFIDSPYYCVYDLQDELYPALQKLTASKYIIHRIIFQSFMTTMMKPLPTHENTPQLDYAHCTRLIERSHEVDRGLPLRRTN